MMTTDPTERTVLISGGASGLGEVTALWFLGLGHPVVVLDLDAKKCEAMTEHLGDRGAVVCGSVLDDADVQRAIDAARTFGNCGGHRLCWWRRGRPHRQGRRSARYGNLSTNT